jgi:hypothetical protein
MVCIYGISRKAGKPRRQKLHSTFDSTSNDQIGSGDAERIDSSGYSSNSSVNGLALDLEHFSHAHDTMATWQTMVHDSSNALMVNLEVSDDPTGDFSALLSTTNYSCADLGEWPMTDHLCDKTLPHNPQLKLPISAFDSSTLDENSSSNDPTRREAQAHLTFYCR